MEEGQISDNWKVQFVRETISHKMSLPDTCNVKVFTDEHIKIQMQTKENCGVDSRTLNLTH